MIPANWKIPNASAKPSWIARAGAEVRKSNAEVTTATVPFATISRVRIARKIRRRNRFLFHMNPTCEAKPRSLVMTGPRSAEAFDLAAIGQDDQVDGERRAVRALALHHDLGRRPGVVLERAEHLGRRQPLDAVRREQVREVLVRLGRERGSDRIRVVARQRTDELLDDR